MGDHCRDFVVLGFVGCFEDLTEVLIVFVVYVEDVCSFVFVGAGVLGYYFVLEGIGGDGLKECVVVIEVR